MDKIIKLDLVEVEMPLKEPYTIAYETISSTTNFFLTLETTGGLRSMGCAAPDEEVTGEKVADVRQRFQSIVEPFLLGQPAFHLSRLMEYLRKHIPDSPSLLAMVDMALYDLMAQKAGLPLYKLLGGYRDSIATSITIGILPLAETLEKAKQYLKEGFFILKIKGGHSVAEDIERLSKLREQFGQEIILRFDANQGYTVQDTLQFVEQARPLNIEILEQPTPSKDLHALGEATQLSHLPVMADESLLTLQDVFKIARNDWADMINIKLMKVGGISHALHINSVARAAGMEAMVGCMDESALGIAAGLHFALARPNVEFADLDGHLDLLNDPFTDCIKIKEGILYPTDRPGLGWLTRL